MLESSGVYHRYVVACKRNVCLWAVDAHFYDEHLLRGRVHFWTDREETGLRVEKATPRIPIVGQVGCG